MRLVLSGLVLFIIAAPLMAQEPKEPRKREREDPGLEGLKALRNDDPEVRYNAAAVMVRLGPVVKFAARELRAAFREETDLEVKVKMAEAVWAVERPPASVLTPFLTHALAAKEPEVRVGAAGVAGQMGPRAKRLIPHLVRTLKDEELSVRIAAVLALGEMGADAKEAAEPLLETIHEKEDPIVDSMAAISLGKMGADVVPLLKKTLEDASFRRRLAAAYALGEMGPVAADAVPGLVKLLGEKETPATPIILQSLGKIGREAKSAMPAIERFTEAKDPGTRLEAALASYLVSGDTKHLSLIHTHLVDEKSGLQYEASLAIRRFGPRAKESAGELRKLLRHRDFKVRMAAALALWSVTGKAEESLQVYQSTIDNSDNNIRARTLEYLTEMGPAAVPLAPLIQEAARDEDDFVRSLARTLLSRLHAKK